MAGMTLDQMEALQKVHELAELENDLEATMATLVDHPVYEMPSLGLRVEGLEAVREAYRRMLPAAVGQQRAWADAWLHGVGPNALCRGAYVYFDTDEGRKTGQYFVVMSFEGDKIKGERMFMCDTYAKEMAKLFNDDAFLTMPGVKLLQDVNPEPVEPDLASLRAGN